MALDREAPGKTARALKLSIREWLAIEKPLAAVGLRRDDVLDILGDPDALDPDGGKRCSFWFVRAEKLRTFTGTTPPKLQELRRKHPDWLEQQTISFVDGSKGIYKHKILVVSHRWEHPDEPDKAGVQFKEVKAHLDAHGAIEFVWFDFWSMPQGKKTGSESAEFKVMLPNINLLYLFCGVLILADLSYVSRFWTQFEAFLSLRTVTANGLESTLEDERRCVIKGIHNAFDNIDKNIIDMWANKTAEEAHEILSKPDVTVTNQSDKDAQLPKLLKLNDFAKKMGAAA